MLIKGQDIKNIIFGNTLSADGLPGEKFDYSLSNPPFGEDDEALPQGFTLHGFLERVLTGEAFEG